MASLLLLVGACTTSSPPPLSAGAPTGTVHAVSNGWHVGLVVARADIGPEQVPEIADLPHFPYLQFGWGDHLYYPDPAPTSWMAVRAAASPSPAVIHVIGMTAAPRAVGGFEVLALEVDVVALMAAVDASFARGAEPRAPIAAPGLHPTSLFYPAEGRFHLFNTCNTWSARMLAAAGVEMAPGAIITAEDLMRRLRPLAQPLASDRLAFAGPSA